MATLNGVPVTTCRVQIPAYGLWWAEVECASPDAITGRVSLAIDDVAFVGTIMSGGAYNTRTRYRIVGGAGGWGRTVGPRSYANDIGVKAALILRDVATECGEVLGVVPPTDSAGPAFVRPSGPASRVLERLYARGWYVDAAGVTQIGRRPAVPFTGEASRMVNDAAQARYEIAPGEGTLSSLVPGIVVDGVEAVDVEHEIDADGALRTTVWGRGIADTSRMSEALRRIVDAYTAGSRFFALWEYRIVQTSGDYVDLQNVRASSGMPDLLHVPTWPRLTYADNTPPILPALGSTVVVAFLNGDPSRPQIMSRAGDPVLVGASAIASAGIVMGGTGSVPTKALVGKIGVGT